MRSAEQNEFICSLFIPILLCRQTIKNGVEENRHTTKNSHTRSGVRNRVAEIMDGRRSVCVTALGMKVLVVSVFLLVGVGLVRRLFS